MTAAATQSDAPIMPTVAMADDIELAVPMDLQEHDQWVLWRYDRRGDDVTKVPCSVRGRLAKANDPRTWASFEEALAAYRRGGFAGIGFVFSADDPFAGVDLDDCRDGDGELDDRARGIVESFGTYTEVSPSGSGVKMLCRADAIPKGKNVGWCELYTGGRFFTITGQRVPGTPAIVNDCSGPFAALYARVTKPKASTNGTAYRNGRKASNGDDNRVARCMAYLDKLPRAVSGSGGHNATFTAACTCYRFGLTDTEADDALKWYNEHRCDPQWEDWELKHKVESAKAEVTAAGDVGKLLAVNTFDGSTNGRKVTGTRRVNGHRVDTETGEIHDNGDDAPDGGVRLTEQGNAEIIAAQHGRDLMYVPQLGQWHAWTGTHWQPDTIGRVVQHAKRIAVHLEQLRGRPGLDQKAVDKHVVRSQSAAGINGTLRLLQTEPGIPVLVDQLDTDPWALNVANGIIDLRTGELRPHNRDERITRCLPWNYDPQAQAPRWMQYLAEVQPDDGMPEYLQRMAGYAATGAINVQEVWCLWGSGANGKSIFHDTIDHTLGIYSGMAPPSLITSTGRDEHPTELADLLGKRLVLATETEEDAKLKVQLIKRLSGDETIKARKMRQDYFEWVMTS
ncbi:MAG: phage/plasmid primase, P4 family [Planctomycetota bacterium]